MQILHRSQGLGGWMQICIGPKGWGGRCKFAWTPLAVGTYANLHRYQGLGGSMQICIDPPRVGGMDANLHRSSQPLIPMPICIGPKG